MPLTNVIYIGVFDDVCQYVLYSTAL